MQFAPKPVKYAVCHETTPEALAEAVNRALAQGFQPHGDLHIQSTGTNQFNYTQAMLKVELRPIELPSDLRSDIVVPQPRIIQ